jgi:hypothetical protein
MTTIPGFLTKTYEIFNTPEYVDCCGWGNNGTTIVIKKVGHNFFILISVYLRLIYLFKSQRYYVSSD